MKKIVKLILSLFFQEVDIVEYESPDYLFTDNDWHNEQPI